MDLHTAASIASITSLLSTPLVVWLLIARSVRREVADARSTSSAKDRAVDEAISLAERMGKVGAIKGAGKLAIALDWARSRCVELRIPADDAHLRKLIELRLHEAKRQPPQ